MPTYALGRPLPSPRPVHMGGGGGPESTGKTDRLEPVFFRRCRGRDWCIRLWCLFSYGACVDDAYFHSLHSPTLYIFIQRILLMRQFSFTYEAYFHSSPSPVALIFTPCILLWCLRKKEGGERKRKFLGDLKW